MTPCFRLAVLALFLGSSPQPTLASDVFFSPPGRTFNGEGDWGPQMFFQGDAPGVFCCPPCSFQLDDGQSVGAVAGGGNAINGTGSFHLAPDGDRPRQYTMTVSAQCWRRLNIINPQTGRPQIVDWGVNTGSMILTVTP